MDQMKVIWSNFSLDKIEEIAEYIELESFEKAQMVVSSILEKAKQLERLPYSGSIEKRLAALDLGYRYLVIYSYKIIYRVIDEQTVYISDVFSCYMDPNKISRGVT